MAIKPQQRVSVAESIYRQLRDSILRGEIKAGDTLPGERVLSEKLKANRAAVREALKRLEQSRLVSIHQGGNTRVCDYRRTATLEIVGQLLINATGQLDPKVSRAMVELRAAISPDIARLATERNSETCASELAEIIKEMHASGDDISRLRALGEEFWGTLARNSDNIAYQLILNSVGEVHNAHAQLLERLLATQYRDTSLFEELYDAVVRKDGAAAYRLARDRSDTIVRALSQQPVEGSPQQDGAPPED